MLTHRSRSVSVIVAAAAASLLLAGCGQAPTHDRIVDLADRTPAPAGGTAGHTPVSSPVHTTAAKPRHTKASHSPNPHKPPKTTTPTTTSPSPSPTPTSSSSAPAPTKSSTPPPPTGNEGVPAFDHILVVVEENEAANAIYGNTSGAPYINSLANNGAKFTASYAITHPSQPNYLALFSGSTQGVTDDTCLLGSPLAANNLGNQLLASGSSFVGYAEELPSAGYLGCINDNYARRHAPWTNFTDLPANQVELPFSKFPTSYSNLPAVSWVIPDLCDDMHGDSNCSGSVSTADNWLKQNLGGYATWAKSNNSLLIVTFDEGTDATNNQIPTIMYGAHVQQGSYSTKITHYSVLRMMEDANNLPYLGAAQKANPVPDIWN